MRTMGLSGNSRQRRSTYRKLCRQYGSENVRRIDNPRTACRGTHISIREVTR